MARLKEKYRNEIAPAIAKEFDIKNTMAIPKVEKIVVNMGLGEGISNSQRFSIRRRKNYERSPDKNP